MRTQPARRPRAASVLFLAPVAVAAVALIALAAASSVPRVARAQRSAIDTYAITGARIVTVSGAEIPRGTVVIRNGLIAAVGAGVAAPPDARVIDGTGLSIYPGLIDANTNLGMPAAPQPARPAAGGGGGVIALLAAQAQATPAVSSPNSSQPVGLQPEILASDVVRPGGEQIEAARNAGLTAALTAPREGIFMGQSAVINLAGETSQAMIVRSPVALHVGFTPLRTGTYPGSLLGVYAAVRQMLLDAGRYREANAVYEKNPRGIRRPDQDKSLAALLPVLSRQMPVVMYADRQRDIERALDLAQEFNLRLIIAGGAESWRVAERLAAAKVPVLLSLNYPRRTTAQTPEADPDPVRVLRERVDAPKTAGRLAAAGVRFAFQSGGLSNMADYLGNVSKSLDNGLARDEAVRALTLRAAEILGVEDRLGTIEVGKIANLTVTRGDLLARERQITHVFIDGRPVDLKPASATPPAGGGARSLASGTWTLRVQLEGQPERSITLTLQQETERLSGSIQGDFGSAQIANASVGASGDIRFTAPITTGTQTTEANFAGTISGNEMRGTVSTVGSGSGTFNGTRAGGGSGGGATTTPAATPTPPTEGARPPE
ncbi:MAG TPA: amidohydrolase family protein [Pyrinomonadaceae bacterium]|nr:amidohydrolase family protein [Pyrinomonadaceae bacterium]